MGKFAAMHAAAKGAAESAQIQYRLVAISEAHPEIFVCHIPVFVGKDGCS